MRPMTGFAAGWEAPRSWRIQEYGDLESIQGKPAGQEVRDLILGALVLFLLAEQLLAMKLSYHPKTAGVAA